MTPDRFVIQSSDLQELTIREIQNIEKIIGKPIGNMGDSPDARTLQAIAYTFKKRAQPDITLDDVLDLVLVIEDSDADPTNGATS